MFNTPARVNPPVAPVMVQNEFDRDVYTALVNEKVLLPVGNDRAEVVVSTSDLNAKPQSLDVSLDVLSKTKSTLYQALDRDKAIGYFNGGVLAPVDYSAMASQESEYLDRTFSEDAVILDSTSHFFGSKSATEFLGFGYQSINQYEYAAQHLHLKRLFTQWDILTSGQSVAEAIQSLADDLGAVVSSMAYSRFIRSSMALKKSVMTANLDARYSMIDAVISLFNRIQKERRETVMQFVKGVVVGLVAKGIQKRRAFNAKQSLDLTRHASGDKSWSFKKLNVFSPRFLGKGKSVGLSIFVQFAENMVQLVVWAFRKVQLERMRLNRKGMLSDALMPFQAGSSAEAVVYFATLQKAGQSVDSDLISEIKSYERYLSIIVKNLEQKWRDQARKVARSQTDEDASFVKEKEALFGKDMLKGDLTSANDWLQEVSAYLDPPTLPHSGRGAPSLFDSILIGRSIRLDGGIWKVTGEQKIGTQKKLTVSQYSETQTLVIDQQTNAVYVDRHDSTSANQRVENHLFGGESVFDINIKKDGNGETTRIQRKNGAIAVMIKSDQAVSRDVAL